MVVARRLLLESNRLTLVVPIGDWIGSASFPLSTTVIAGRTFLFSKVFASEHWVSYPTSLSSSPRSVLPPYLLRFSHLANWMLVIPQSLYAAGRSKLSHPTWCFWNRTGGGLLEQGECGGWVMISRMLIELSLIDPVICERLHVVLSKSVHPLEKGPALKKKGVMSEREV